MSIIRSSKIAISGFLLALPLLLGCAPGDEESSFDCEDGKCDSASRCYEFNSECGEDLICRPIGEMPGSDQFCLPPSTKDAYCDDDDDCEGERVCLDDGIKNGVCTGVVEEDERCFDFNYFCAEGLVCRPIDKSVGSEQFCLPPSTQDAYCDDDDDCAGQRVCVENSSPYNNGTCRGIVEQDSRCYEFNFECRDEGLSCRPINKVAGSDQFCLPPATDGYCDDDDDCAGDRVCVGDNINNGSCEYI